MVRTGNVDFSCKRLTSIEIRKSKYHIIRRVRFRWEPTPPPPPHTTPPPPPRKISGSALALLEHSFHTCKRRQTERSTSFYKLIRGYIRILLTTMTDLRDQDYGLIIPIVK